MSRFKVGDEVRVKAGATTYPTAPNIRSYGTKLVVTDAFYEYGDGYYVVNEDGAKDFLNDAQPEPWNPAEEWDGAKWVPKKSYRGILATDHIVILRENGVLKPNSPPHVHASLEDASKEAKRLAEKHKGQEFCVFGLKAVEKREKPDYPSFRPGDKVLITGCGPEGCRHWLKQGLAIVVRDYGNDRAELEGVHTVDGFLLQQTVHKDVIKPL